MDIQIKGSFFEYCQGCPHIQLERKEPAPVFPQEQKAESEPRFGCRNAELCDHLYNYIDRDFNKRLLRKCENRQKVVKDTCGMCLNFSYVVGGAGICELDKGTTYIENKCRYKSKDTEKQQKDAESHEDNGRNDIGEALKPKDKLETTNAEKCNCNTEESNALLPDKTCGRCLEFIYESVVDMSGMCRKYNQPVFAESLCIAKKA